MKQRSCSGFLAARDLKERPGALPETVMIVVVSMLKADTFEHDSPRSHEPYSFVGLIAQAPALGHDKINESWQDGHGRQKVLRGWSNRT